MKNAALGICTLLLVLSSYRIALPVGIGGYFELCSGGNSWNGKSIKETESDLTPAGGLILDTAVTKDDMVHYRFKAGAGSTFSGNWQFYRAGVTHTFGFFPGSQGSSEEVRFWLGPRVGLFYTGGKYHFVEPLIQSSLVYLFPAVFANPILWSLPVKYDVKASMFRAQLGLVIAGFNFNFGESTLVTFEFGFDYVFTAGRDNFSNTIMAHGWEASGTVAVLYRVNKKITPPK